MTVQYDQHFMINKEVLKYIGNLTKKKDKVLEIGAGHGELTQFLNGKITSLEIDQDLFKLLKAKIKNVNFINTNALKYNLNNFDIILGNLPYYICESLFNKLIKTKFKQGIFMIPRNFIEKGVLNYVIKDFFNIEILKEINKEDFLPLPKTESVLIKITPKEPTAFGLIYLQNTKKLKNAIEYALTKKGYTQKQAKEKMPNLKFLNKKCFELNFEEWLQVIGFSRTIILQK